MDLAVALGVAEPRMKRGDIWALGKSLLMCGDARNVSDVGRLVGRQEIAVMVADAPYGVGLDHGWRRALTGGTKSIRVRGMTGDDRADWGEVWGLWCPQVLYLFHSGDHAHEVREGLERAGYEVRQQIIWAKQAVLSRSYYHWAHEPIWFAVRKGHDARWRGDRTQTTVWSYRSPLVGLGYGGPEDEATAHPSQKPSAVYEIPIRNHTGYGEVVADPFAGSGTMGIAAERTGRRALMMEIEPWWCEVTIRRWERYTGMPAQRVER